MRNELAKIEGERSVFTGVFVRFGEKNGYKGSVTTVLLQNIHDATGKKVTDHLWFNLTKGFAALNLKGGEKIEFRARVKDYLKGYQGDETALMEIDYKLSHPTKVHVKDERFSEDR